MSLTMADVAKRAGVSVSTVSLALNEKPGVSSSVRAAVWQAVDELGYTLPTRRRRRPRQTKTIAIVHYGMPDLNRGPQLTGLAASYLSGIQEECLDKHANWALIAHYQEADSNNVGYQFLVRERLGYDGLILIYAPSRESAVLQRALKQEIPVVVISRDWPDLPVSTVGQDHPQQARLALEYLIRLGHRTIAFLALESDRPYDWFGVRLSCYQQAMTSLGTHAPELEVIAPDAAQATQVLLARRPDVTAIYAVHDGAALAAMRGLQQAGIEVPRQVSVIGIGDSEVQQDLPALTTVGFPDRKVGFLAAKVLLEHIEDPELSYSKVFVDSWVVERDSCAAPNRADWSQKGGGPRELGLPDQIRRA
jgi:DNA-binding LacI/PurR family transcriptional regulator